MDYRKEIIQAAKKMAASDLTIETWGNISFYHREAGKIYITPSALPYNRLRPKDIALLDPAGKQIGGRHQASSEKALHLAIYQKRPAVCAIFHTHGVESTVFACLGWEIPLFTDEGAQVLKKPVQTAPYALPGSTDLADGVKNTLGDGTAVLLRSHGAVTVGSTLAEAFRRAKVLETTARIYRLALTMGEPLPLPPEVVAAMANFEQSYKAKKFQNH